MVSFEVPEYGERPDAMQDLMMDQERVGHLNTIRAMAMEVRAPSIWGAPFHHEIKYPPNRVNSRHEPEFAKVQR